MIGSHQSPIANQHDYDGHYFITIDYDSGVNLGIYLCLNYFICVVIIVALLA